MYNSSSRNVDRALNYHHRKFYTLAIEFYDKALQEFPDDPMLLANRAEEYILVGRWEEAIRDFKIVLAGGFNNEAVWVNFGLALQCSGQYEAALVAYDQALTISESAVFALFNKGVCLERELGRTGEGVPYFKKALEIDPTFSNAIGGMSFYNLKTGNFADGWQDFEYRNIGGASTKMPGLVWDGVPTTDNLILVGEQGLGDVLQFCRYAKVAAFNGQKTSLYITKEFHPLLSSLGPDVQLMSEPEEVVEPYQWLPLMSMPRLLGTTVTTIPAMPRYLSSTPERIAMWKAKMLPWKDNFKIGICWQPGHQWLPHVWSRIIPLDMFADMAAIPGVQLFSLQKDEPAGQRHEVDFEIIDLGGDLIPRKDVMMDAAAIIENLDLVISTDSAILHLAAAVGCNTFAAIPKGSCWRWLEEDREDSPWYPTMKLFRQTRVLDWCDPFARMTDAVRELAGSPAVTA